MRNSLIKLIALACAVSLFSSLAAAQQQPSAPATRTAPDQHGVPPPSVFDPTFNLRGLDGRTYALAQMRGEVVLVSFGATWCAPCLPELVALDQLREEYRDRPVRFLWITVESEREISDSRLRDFVRRNRLTFPVLRDTTGAVIGQFGIRMRLPMLVLFDREGRVAGQPHFGMSGRPDVFKANIRARLNALLAGAGSAESTSQRNGNQ